MAGNAISQRRKLVCGVGINDLYHVRGRFVKEKYVKCPFYEKWSNMIIRCYSKNKRECYKGCTVSDEWLVFSNFRNWMVSQDWENKELDKDILVKGNKLYSPETCIFIDQHINTLLINKGAGRGKYALGVTFCKLNKKFRSSCSKNGKLKSLGYFKTEKEAHNAYCNYKYQAIKEAPEGQKGPLKNALLNYEIDFR